MCRLCRHSPGMIVVRGRTLVWKNFEQSVGEGAFLLSAVTEWEAGMRAVSDEATDHGVGFGSSQPINASQEHLAVISTGCRCSSPW
jgi:hypothetical protein